MVDLYISRRNEGRSPIFVILFKIASVSITVISYLLHFNYHKHVVNRNLIFNDHILIVIGVGKIELQ